MVAQAPPTDYSGTPNFFLLKAGTVLYRCHRETRDAVEFNPRTAHSHFGGGRFDATDEHPYPYYYAGMSKTTALAERLLRNVHYDHEGFHLLPRSSIEGIVLSRIETAVDLRLISLVDSVDLGAIAQTSWLIHSTDYPKTRYWGHWLRERCTDAQGIIWQSSRDIPKRTLVLFGDRCEGSDPLLRPVGAPVPIDTPPGIDELRTLLAPYRVTV
jgi:hypothetical protein